MSYVLPMPLYGGCTIVCTCIVRCAQVKDSSKCTDSSSSFSFVFSIFLFFFTRLAMERCAEYWCIKIVFFFLPFFSVGLTFIYCRLSAVFWLADIHKLAILYDTHLDTVLPQCHAQWTGAWPFGATVCNLWVTCDILFCSSSIWHMVIISVGRYIGIRNPLHARQTPLLVSRRAVLVKIALAWLLSALITSPITILALIDQSNIQPDPSSCLVSNRYFLFLGKLEMFSSSSSSLVSLLLSVCLFFLVLTASVAHSLSLSYFSSCFSCKLLFNLLLYLAILLVFGTLLYIFSLACWPFSCHCILFRFLFSFISMPLCIESSFTCRIDV